MTATNPHPSPLRIIPTREQLKAARRTLAGFVVVAAATGAVPVPAASAAIIIENSVMIGALSNALGQEIGLGEVIAAFGLVGTANQVGRALFVEGARMIGWAGGPFGIAAVSALGALTAAAQTWLIGEVVILLAKKGGALPTAKELRGLQSQMWKETKRILGTSGNGRAAKKGGPRK